MSEFKKLIKEFITEIHPTKNKKRSGAYVSNNRVEIGSSYLKKEKVREEIQRIISNHVKNEEITSQEDLDSFVKDLEISLLALKAIPFDVWKKL